ncbi:MAG: YidB family protein [Burkholderiaceae bacterium]|jgi:uncharacterized protein YidB (DUF937 family)
MGLLDSMLGSVLNSQQEGGQGGGPGGLMEKFNQAGMGDVLGSWIGSGQNAPISGADLGAVFTVRGNWHPATREGG